jgi:choline dehydrogenase-like flavoprotein
MSNHAWGRPLTGCTGLAIKESIVPSAAHFDVVIIGTGAGGGTLVHKLAPSGKRILLLERGDYVPREKANWDPRLVNLEGKYQTKEVSRDKDGAELHPHTNYNVGGNTKFYGAALFRLRREDFGEIRHHGGISPAWPFSYNDLEPYYTQAERMYHVHGIRGEDPTEPPSNAPYPHPPVSHEPRIQHLADDFARLGLRPFHTPLGGQGIDAGHFGHQLFVVFAVPWLIEMELLVEISLFEEGQQMDAPAQQRLAIFVEVGIGGKRLINVVVVVHGEGHLMEVIHGAHAVGCLPGTDDPGALPNVPIFMRRLRSSTTSCACSLAFASFGNKRSNLSP